jgi:hypothetical protein
VAEGSAHPKYNIPLINALVLYVGTQAIAQIAAKNQTPSMTTITHSSHMDIFQNLAVDLDSEGTVSHSLLCLPIIVTFYFLVIHELNFCFTNSNEIEESGVLAKNKILYELVIVDFFSFRSLSAVPLHLEPPEVPKQPHALLLVLFALLVHGGQLENRARTDRSVRITRLQGCNLLF